MLTLQKTPVLVIGTGISGLFTALKLSHFNLQVLLVTKSGLADNNSRYAQGGIAAVLPENLDDSLELHVQDTLRAGAGLCNEEATRSLLAEGYPAILDLLAFGVPFDRNTDEGLALTQEAAHSRRRILHAGGDATGQSVELTLIDKVRNDPNITVMEHCQVTELLRAGNTCYGCRAVTLADQQEWLFLSPCTVLATGGVGQLYSHTTNPAIATGDGISLAFRAGASLTDMEFVQFHPTAFYADGKVQFLISEALRGEGGILRDHQGVPFSKTYHPDAELAPRDVLTRAIYTELQEKSVPHVYLDITHLPPETIEKRFPTILAHCLRFNIDIRKEAIPVAPAAHYMMGGVTVDTQGKTSVDGLYAVGEVAHTGLHGANRLASNSLLECVVLARRVAIEIQEQQPTLEAFVPPEPLNLTPSEFAFTPPTEIQTRLAQLHQCMWETVGIIRDGAVLEGTLNALKVLEIEALSQGWEKHLPWGMEYLNQLQVARFITQAAFDRKESRGAHYRSDFPREQSDRMIACAPLPHYALAANL